MKFEHEGATYFLDFQRDYKQVEVGNTAGEVVRTASHYPSTTVILWKQRENPLAPELYRTATVGCWHKDTFTLEKGRLNAMRLMSRTLSKEMKRKMWASYMNRKVVG